MTRYITTILLLALPTLAVAQPPQAPKASPGPSSSDRVVV
jgi:hypothetical protein